MTTEVMAKIVYCANARCDKVRARPDEPRYLGEHHAGCRVQCPSCRAWTVVR